MSATPEQREKLENIIHVATAFFRAPGNDPCPPVFLDGFALEALRAVLADSETLAAMENLVKTLGFAGAPIETPDEAP